MVVTIIVMIILFAMHNFLQGMQDPLLRKQREKTFVFEACGLFILLAAIRYVIPYSDASGYMEHYEAMSSLSFKEVYESSEVSYVYFLLSKLFSLSRLSYHFWFAFIELLYVSAFVRMVNKFSEDKILCLFLFYTIGLYSFSFHGLKQILAMVLIWHGFMDIYEKKYLRSAILVVLAYYCHKTSMVFLLAYIMPFIGKFGRLSRVLIILLSSILVFSYTSVLVQLTGDERYASYLDGREEGYSASQFMFYIILFGVAFYAKNQGMGLKKQRIVLKNRGVGLKKQRIVLKKQGMSLKDERLIIGLAVITIFSQLFAFRVASAFRLSLYFLPFLIIYISNQLKNTRDVQYLMFFICAIWILYTGRNTFYYKFFWQ